ncbi:MAG: hypothetical protein FWD88_06645, partial [Treponema sp.]|nr:hypothetical protein [Treponema sp.]
MRHPFPRLLVLVPHRDARLPMRAWSGSLFAGGLLGAWSFPWVVPLAALDRPLPDAELRSIAGIIREHSRPNGGKFTGGPAALAPLPFATPLKPVFALGPTLDIVPPGFFPETFGGTPISPTVWGAALVYGPM